jgi:hypothetical protein
MKPAPHDDKPLCGSRANELGVRPGVDITADEAVYRTGTELDGLL